MMNDEIKEILDDLLFTTTLPNVSIKLNKEKLNQLKDYITNLQHTEDLYNQLLKDYDELQQENERLNREVAKLHIIREEYGSHIENTHIIDDYQKTYFMTNKYLIELKNGKFVYVDELNDKYEDYKSRCEKAVEYIKINFVEDIITVKTLLNILNGRSDE